MPEFSNIWEVTPETAHPRARKLIGQSLIWDYGDEDSPLGNDIGADIFSAYLSFRATHHTINVHDFLQEQLRLRGIQDWFLDSFSKARLDELLKSESGVELMRHDDLIIGLAFAQFTLDGIIDPTVGQRAISALVRQSTDGVLSFRGGGGESARKAQLIEFRRILESAM